MRLTPAELLFFAECWRLIGMRRSDAGRLLEARMRRKVAKRGKGIKRKSKAGPR